jgi:hypothetical protein
LTKVNLGHKPVAISCGTRTIGKKRQKRDIYEEQKKRKRTRGWRV